MLLCSVAEAQLYAQHQRYPVKIGEDARRTRKWFQIYSMYILHQNSQSPDYFFARYRGFHSFSHDPFDRVRPKSVPLTSFLINPGLTGHDLVIDTTASIVHVCPRAGLPVV
jgi:hypothetical protein